MTNNYIENRFILNINFKILYLNRFESGGVFTHVTHSHAFSELFYILSGEGYLLLDNDEKVFLKEGDFLIVNPHIRHCEYSLSDPSMGFAVYGLSDISFQKYGKQPPYLHLRKENAAAESEQINRLYDNIRFEMSNQKDLWENMVHAYLEQLIIYATRVMGVKVCKEPYSGDDALKRAQEFIENHLDSKIDLDEMARFACVNKCTLINLFKREFGLTPMRYVMQQRIYKAIELMTNTEKSLDVIIGECGFLNSAHFYQAFKRITGGTPSQYRNGRTRK